MSWRMPGAEESASSITTASFGSISPMACSKASGCTGLACASARALAVSASRSAAIALVAAANRSRAARAAGQAFTHGGRDVRQRGLRIAEDGDLRRIVFAELPGIDVEMNELDRGRHRIDVGRKRQGEQIAADREQHVVLVEHLAYVGRQPDHGSAEQRM